MKKAKATPRQQTPPKTEMTDPIWAVIEKHRQELAAFTIIADRPGDIPADAIDGVRAAGYPLLTTRPTTLAGAIAVLRYVRSQHDEDLHDGAACPSYLPLKVDGEIWAYAFLENIADALSLGLNKIVAVTGGAVPEASPSIADFASSSLIEIGKRFDNHDLEEPICDVRDMRLVCSAAFENANPEYGPDGEGVKITLGSWRALTFAIHQQGSFIDALEKAFYAQETEAEEG